MDLLLVNHCQVNCEAYQYGKRLSEKLVPAPNWELTYKELNSEAGVRTSS